MGVLLKQKWNIYKRKPLSLIFLLLTWLCALVTVGILIYILVFILVRGIPHINLEFLFGTYNTDTLSAFSSIVSTLIMIVLSLLIAVPIGVFCSIYLVEYAKRGSKMVRLVKLAVETLAGIPSIIYGLFGMIFFVTMMGLKTSLLSGIFTIAIMILPIIISSTEETLRGVPDSYREGSFGLGAGRLRTVFAVVLPAAVPGIMSGIILAIGRIVGETAALIFTSGTNVNALPTFNLLASQRTLAIHMYMLAVEGLPHSRDMAFATGAILIIIVFIVNLAAEKLGGKLQKGKK